MQSRVFPTRYILLLRKCVAYMNTVAVPWNVPFLFCLCTLCHAFCLLNMHMQCVLYVLDSHLINCGFCLIGRGGPKQHYIIMSILRQNTRIIIKELNRLQWVSGNIYYNMKPDY